MTLRPEIPSVKLAQARRREFFGEFVTLGNASRRAPHCNQARNGVRAVVFCAIIWILWIQQKYFPITDAQNQTFGLTYRDRNNLVDFGRVPDQTGFLLHWSH